MTGKKKRSDPPIAKFITRYELYAKAAGFSQAQVDHVRRCVTYFDRFMGGISDPAAISANDFRRFLNDLRIRPVWQGRKNEQPRFLSGTSINTYARVVKTFFNWMAEQNIIPVNPLENVRLPKKPKTLPKIYSVEELQAVIKTAESSILDNAIFSLFIDSGIRLNELTQIKMGGLDVPGGRVKVMGKGRKERISYFGTDAAKCLELYVKTFRRGAKKDDFLFLREDGLPLSKSGVQTRLVRLGKKAGIEERLAPHKLRHSFATLGLKYGANVEYLRIMMGHTDVKTTVDSYLNVQDADVKEAHTKFSPLTNLKHKQTNPPSEGTTNDLTLSVKEDFKTTSVLKSPQDSQSVSGETGRAGEPNGRNDGLGTHWDVFAPTTIRIETSPCIASPDDIATTIPKSWGVPAKIASDIILRWRAYHREGKHQFCRLYLNFRDDLITRNISFGGAIRLLDAGIEATNLKSEKLLQAVDIARIYQPWKSRNDQQAYFAELRALGEPFFEAREQYLNDIKNLLTRWLVDVDGCRSTKEYRDIFKIEKDPLFEAMIQHCIKVASAFMKLKLVWQQLQNISADNIHSEDDVRASGPSKKKQRRILQSKFERSVRELQRIINNTLRNKWYEDVWFFDYLQASKE